MFLIKGDCNDHLSDIKDVDLVITSPPYDGLRDYGHEAFNFKRTALQLARCLKPGGVIVWVVGDQTDKQESGTSFRQALYFQKIGLHLHDTMIYRKQNPLPTGGSTRYRQCFEYMFVFSKGKPATFNPILRPRKYFGNPGAPSHHNGHSKVKRSFGPIPLDNIWTYPVGGGVSVEIGCKHPAAYPEALVRDHIKSWSNPGDLVLDPMMGSGTTGIVAIQEGRRFIGIEINEDYFNYAKERLDVIDDIHSKI